MDIEDLEPQSKKPGIKNLEIMSIEALCEYIEELEAEISHHASPPPCGGRRIVWAAPMPPTPPIKLKYT